MTSDPGTSIEAQPQISVKSYSTKEVLQLFHTNPEIANHIIRGYGIPTTDTRTPEQIVEDEFSHGKDRTRIFLAFVDGKVVGNLYFILWKNNADDKRGARFIDFLREHGNGILDIEQLSKHEILACDIGIVVDPAYRGKGVVNELYHYGVAEINPAFMVGQTKTPAAVFARMKILEELGYSTAYGGKSGELSEKVASLITEAYYYSKFDVVDRIGDKNIHYAQTEALQPDIDVDFSRLSGDIANTFLEIVEAYKNRPESKITFSPLISMKKSLLV